MKNPKEEKEPATEQITDLVEEAKNYLEEKTGIKLFAETVQEINKEPFWRISKDKESKGIICTIYYYPATNELGFWCTHENLTPGKYSEYDELKKKLEELSRDLGLTLKDLNKRKRIR